MHSPATVNKIFANAVVINLDRRPDRLRGVRKRLQKAGVRAKRFPAVDGRFADIPPSLVARSWDASMNAKFDPNSRSGELVMTAGERGCAVSHIQVWVCAASRSHPTLVLEDDAVPCDNFRQETTRVLAALPTDAEFLYLGPAVAKWHKKEHRFAEVGRPKYCWGLHGYIIWPAVAKLLLEALPITAPVDNWLAEFTVCQSVRAFAPTDLQLCVQLDPWANGDIEHSSLETDEVKHETQVAPLVADEDDSERAQLASHRTRPSTRVTRSQARWRECVEVRHNATQDQ